MPCPVLILQKNKKCKNDTETHRNTHQGGMVRFHLLSLPLPLISHTKQLPKIVTVDIRQTQNIFKYNILYFTISSRCFILTPKAISPAERKSCLLAFCGSGQQEEIFYSMAATIVRLEENSYRQSWKEAEAVLFLPLSVSSGEV